jgi:hypothetical protein
MLTAVAAERDADEGAGQATGASSRSASKQV